MNDEHKFGVVVIVGLILFAALLATILSVQHAYICKKAFECGYEQTTLPGRCGVSWVKVRR